MMSISSSSPSHLSHFIILGHAAAAAASAHRPGEMAGHSFNIAED
jgi:hypothetical protein